jgi:hypothetical protein
MLCLESAPACTRRSLGEIPSVPPKGLWDRVENERKTYAMGLWEWTKVELALTKDLAEARVALLKAA